MTHSSASISRAVSGLRCFALLTYALGCGGAQSATSKPTDAKSINAQTPSQDACAQYGDRMCKALGDESEGCMAVRQVSTWLPGKACDAALVDVDQSLSKVTALRGDCDTFTKKVCDELGEESTTCAMVKRDMAEIAVGHCPKLLAAYPTLIAQLAQRERSSKPLDADTQKALLEGTPPSFGPADAKVTVVEFSDFECPYCSSAAQTVAKVKTKYADRVKLVFRQFPLPFHSHARSAAQAALAAHAQGKFWAFHDLLFANQRALTDEDLAHYASEAGLDAKAFQAALADAAITEKINSDVALGERVGVQGTPTMFINGERVENPTDYDSVASKLDELLEAAE
jgi:protein-disulfide isomerase